MSSLVLPNSELCLHVDVHQIVERIAPSTNSEGFQRSQGDRDLLMSFGSLQGWPEGSLSTSASVCTFSAFQAGLLAKRQRLYIFLHLEIKRAQTFSPVRLSAPRLGRHLAIAAVPFRRRPRRLFAVSPVKQSSVLLL